MLVLTDGITALPLVTAQDHKRLLDGDKGPNTGGMGAYAPAPVVTDALAKQIMEQIIRPTLQGLASEGILFRGVLYTGVMLTADGPKVLEYNVRFGDPETQVIIPLLANDLVPLLDDAIEGRLSQHRCQWHPGSCVSVVLASGGYPGEFQIGKEIRGLEAWKQREDLLMFHAGTKRDRERLLSWGGRVLNVVARDADLEGALKKAYEVIGTLGFEGMTYRKDIAWRAIHKPVQL
jgi:phosphoribosylamine--glycine ligase